MEKIYTTKKPLYTNGGKNMVDYAAAIKKPFSDMQTAGLGIILGFIPVLNILVSGYGIGIARKTVNKDNSLPKWDPNQVVKYIIDALMAIVILIVYQIPAGILLVIGAAMAGGVLLPSILTGNMDAIISAGLDALAVGGPFILIGGLLGLIGGLLSIMGVIAYAKDGSLGAAFKIKTLSKKVLSVPFLASIIVLVIYQVVLVLISLILLIIPVIGVFLGAGLMTYALTVTGLTLFAEVYNETP